MSFLQTFDRLSYKKIASIVVFMSILFAVPVAVVLVQQQTRMNSRAAYEKPKLASEPKATPGPIPINSPKIGRVFPWVGKTGDIIWLQGKNFGTNPEYKSLIIGGQEIFDAYIDAWEDDMIQAYLPEGIKQGSIIQIKVGDHPSSRSLPIIIYDQDTKVKLHKNANVITAENADDISKALIWTGDDEIATKKHTEKISSKSVGETYIFNTEGLPILTIVLLDNKGKIIPYYVDPVEFDF